MDGVVLDEKVLLLTAIKVVQNVIEITEVGGVQLKDRACFDHVHQQLVHVVRWLPNVVFPANVAIFDAIFTV